MGSRTQLLDKACHACSSLRSAAEVFTAPDTGLLPACLQSRLQKALSSYERAIVLAVNLDEKASAAKNLGLAHQRHMQLNGREALEAAGKLAACPYA